MIEWKMHVKHAEIFITDEINDDSPSQLQTALNAIGDTLPLTVHINSAGGNVFSGVAMANMIARHKGETTSINDGLTASIATQIFFSADHCQAPANAFFMVHAPTIGNAGGNAADMRKVAETLDTIQRGLESTYQRKARGSVSHEQISDMMSRETWLTAQEAATFFDIEVVAPKHISNFANLKMLEAQGISVPSTIRNAQNKIDNAEKLRRLLDESAVYLKSISHERKDDVPMTENTLSTNADDSKKLYNAAFNKVLFNPIRAVPMSLTLDERRTFENAIGSPGLVEGVPARGGVMVSVEQIDKLLEYRKAFVALKDYVNLQPALSNHGRQPVLPVQNIHFTAFDELDNVAEDHLIFDELTYTIKDFGLIVPASNELLEDSSIDIIDVIGRTLARAAVTTENEKILAAISPLLSNSAALTTSWRDINRALFKTLDGAYTANAKLYTNQDGFLWLCDLEDSQNRPLVTPDLAEPERYLYRGHEIVVIPNSQLDNIVIGSDSFAPLIIGDLSSYLTFFQRKGLELSASREYLWKRNGFAIRAIMRFDAVISDTNAITALRIQI